MSELATALPVATETDRESIQRYYEEAGPDYAVWSKHFNMHFGYFRGGMNPFNREKMLEQMNEEILRRLRLDDETATGVPARILDMGCGLSATLRSFARRLPSAQLSGITLVPWQVEEGNRLNQSCAETARIQLSVADYENTAFASNSFDAVYAVESSCYAHGTNKSAFLQEAHRLLRPGGRIVVADGFLGTGTLIGPQKWIYRTLCDCWAIDALGEVEKFTREIERIGFREVSSSRCRPALHPLSFTFPGSRSNSCLPMSSSASGR